MKHRVLLIDDQPPRPVKFQTTPPSESPCPIYPEANYTGHDWDDVLGMYYAKARFYDPAAKRFVAMDPVKGNVFEPLSLVSYLYCVDNPLKYVDPMGLMSVELLRMTAIKFMTGGFPTLMDLLEYCEEKNGFDFGVAGHEFVQILAAASVSGNGYDYVLEERLLNGGEVDLLVTRGKNAWIYEVKPYARGIAEAARQRMSYYKKLICDSKNNPYREYTVYKEGKGDLFIFPTLPIKIGKKNDMTIYLSVTDTTFVTLHDRMTRDTSLRDFTTGILRYQFFGLDEEKQKEAEENAKAIENKENRINTKELKIIITGPKDNSNNGGGGTQSSYKEVIIVLPQPIPVNEPVAKLDPNDSLYQISLIDQGVPEPGNPAVLFWMLAVATPVYVLGPAGIPFLY